MKIVFGAKTFQSTLLAIQKTSPKFSAAKYTKFSPGRNSLIEFADARLHWPAQRVRSFCVALHWKVSQKYRHSTSNVWRAASYEHRRERARELMCFPRTLRSDEHALSLGKISNAVEVSHGCRADWRTMALLCCQILAFDYEIHKKNFWVETELMRCCIVVYYILLSIYI